MNIKSNLINKISEALPQLQCKKCGYKDCISYAYAVVKEKEALNKCEPGQQKTEQQLKEILQGSEKLNLNEIKNYKIASIHESECIGCTICIKVCPIDAIVGAKKQKHFVIDSQCNGCISQCPVDCMTMINNPMGSSWSWPSKKANKSKDDYHNRLSRIKRIRSENIVSKKQLDDGDAIENYIKGAIEREAKKYKKFKEYG